MAILEWTCEWEYDLDGYIEDAQKYLNTHKNPRGVIKYLHKLIEEDIDYMCGDDFEAGYYDSIGEEQYNEIITKVLEQVKPDLIPKLKVFNVY